MEPPRIYTREYYQRIADLEERHWWHCGMREIAAALIRSQDHSGPYIRVLDAGCGTGAGMAWAQNALAARTVIGVDISAQALTLRRSQPERLLAQASALQLPFRSESFDLLVCQDVVQHLPTDGADVRALAEMRRVLRPGGLLLVRANSRLGLGQDDAARDVDFQRYTLPELTARVQAAGFRVLRATYANALPALYASVKDWCQRRSPRHHQSQHLYEGLRMRDTVTRHPWLNTLLLRILQAEALYLSTFGRRLAFGHSTFCVGMRSL